MQPILTVTLNPALDLAGSVPHVIPGPKLRVTDLTIEPGGGGINVARVIHRLGGPVTALAGLGGPAGDRITRLLEAEGVRVRRLDVPGDTRESLAITDSSDGQQFRFVLPGPEWEDTTVQSALDAIVEAAPAGGWMVLSGSQPPGVPADFPQRLTRALAGQRTRLVIDTSGDALAALYTSPQAESRPAVLRMDRAESEALAGRALNSAEESLTLASAMVDRGVASLVVLARGAEGSVMAAEGMRLLATPPHVTVESAVGAGDSFTGAFTLALFRGEAPAEALRHGTAAAAAAVTTPATDLCHAADVARLLAGCRVVAA